MLQQTVERGKTLQKTEKVKGLGKFPRKSLEDIFLTWEALC